jgi:dipeptide/tripeptide permease
MMKSQSHVEQIKLTANLLNALSSGTILGSIVAPYIGFGMGTMIPGSDWTNLAGLSAFGLICGLILHLYGRRVLFGLDE